MLTAVTSILGAGGKLSVNQPRCSTRTPKGYEMSPLKLSECVRLCFTILLVSIVLSPVILMISVE